MGANRILVIKHGALGDIIQGLDSFSALRKGHPDAHIALLTTRPFAELAGLMPWFDEIIIDGRVPFFNVRATLQIRALLRRGWDMIIDQQCSSRTNKYHQLLAPRTVNWFGTAKGASNPYPDFTGVNNNQRMLVAARMAGGIDGDASDNAMDWLDGAVGELALQMPAKAAILVPGCSPAKPQKRWHVTRFVALAEALQKAEYDVVIVGTNAERATVDELIAAAPFCHDFVGKTSLAQLAALFRRGDLVVGNDTGPVFLAARTGVPTIMVMGADTDPSMSAPTGANCGWVRGTVIDDVTPQQVLEKASEMGVSLSG